MIQKVYQLKIRGFDCENSYFHFTTENKITSRLSIVVFKAIHQLKTALQALPNFGKHD